MVWPGGGSLIGPPPFCERGRWQTRSIPVPDHGDSDKLHAALMGVIMFVPQSAWWVASSARAIPGLQAGGPGRYAGRLL